MQLLLLLLQEVFLLCLWEEQLLWKHYNLLTLHPQPSRVHFSPHIPHTFLHRGVFKVPTSSFWASFALSENGSWHAAKLILYELLLFTNGFFVLAKNVNCLFPPLLLLILWIMMSKLLLQKFWALWLQYHPSHTRL